MDLYWHRSLRPTSQLKAAETIRSPCAPPAADADRAPLITAYDAGGCNTLGRPRRVAKRCRVPTVIGTCHRTPKKRIAASLLLVGPRLRRLLHTEVDISRIITPFAESGIKRQLRVSFPAASFPLFSAMDRRCGNLVKFPNLGKKQRPGYSNSRCDYGLTANRENR